MLAIVSHRNRGYDFRRAPATWKDAARDFVRVDIVDRPASRVSRLWTSDKVKVQVYCAALNYFDLNRVYAGLVGAEGNKYEGFGSEVAGRVLAVGRGVSGFQEGELVVTRLSGTCGACPFCRQGRPGCKSMAAKPADAFQQEVWLSAGAIQKIERGVTPLEAVACQFSGSIASQLVERTFPVTSGDRVLVTAANSAAGACVVQMAVRKNADVVALTRSQDTVERCRVGGAAAALVVHPEEETSGLRKRIAAEAPPSVFDKVFDFAADYYSRVCLGLVRPGGFYVFAGKSGSADSVLPERDILELGVSLHPYHYHNDGFSGDVLKKVSAGQVSPAIDSIFPFEQAAAACQRAWWTAGKFGKVLLVFAEPGLCHAPAA